VIVGVVAVYLVLFSILNTPEAEDDIVDDRIVRICQYEKTFVWEVVLFIVEGIYLLYGMYLCWAVRKVQKGWNESRYIGFAV